MRTPLSHLPHTRLLAVLGMLVIPGLAAAETVTLECLGTHTAHYEPGITETPKPTLVNASAVYGPCVGLPLTIVSGTATSVTQGEFSCLFNPDPARTFLTVNWNDGTTSRVEHTSVVATRPLGKTVIVFEGSVVGGRFLGARVVRTVTLLNTDLLGCFTPEGVSDVAGPVTITITSLL